MMDGCSLYMGDLPGLRPLVPAFYRAPRGYRFTIMRASKLTGYGYSEIVGAGRAAPLARIRWAVMLALRKRGLSFPQIGRMLGGRDHTTIMHGIKRGEELLASDAEFAALVSMVAAA